MQKFLALLFFVGEIAFAQTPHPCAFEAGKQAQRLLSFYINDKDERINIDKKVAVLSPIRNPGNKTQSFDVLEVWGSVYKARYRMRFLYAQMENCVLMGEEIMELASL